MKKFYSIISLVVFLIFIAAGTIFIWVNFSKYWGNYDLFKEYIDSYGFNSYLIFVGIQILQIFFALIPGEFIELVAGYVFGGILGFILCMIGIAIASTIIFFLVRIFGRKMIEAITDNKDFNKLKFLNNESKLNLTVFILFLIPGTPKDLLTYFLGITKIKYTHFIAITMFARIPSVLSSTIAGASSAQGRYVLAILLFGITAVISLAGILFYRKFIKKREIDEPTDKALSQETTSP